MKGSMIIIKKELFRVFGDRKLIFSMFLLPPILYIMIYSIMGKAINSVSNDIVAHTSIVYVVNAPEGLDTVLTASSYRDGAEVSMLSESEYKAQREALETEILEGATDLLVYFPEDFSSMITAYKNAGDAIPGIDLFFNSSEDYSSRAYSVFINTVLSPFRNTLLAGRIGNLEALNVFSTNDRVIVKEAKANSQFISMMLPYLVILMLFTGAMSLCVDAIAGEKERGTMASMLLSPIKRSELVFGKLIALAILAAISATCSTIGMVCAIPLMGNSMSDAGENGFGGLELGPVQVLQLLAILITLVYLFVSIISLLSVLAKDTKTASTYISPCMIIVTVVGVLSMFAGNGTVDPTKYAIPVYGTALAIKDICACELTTGHFLISLASTVVCAIIFTVAITRAFNSEKVMFNA